MGRFLWQFAYLGFLAAFLAVPVAAFLKAQRGVRLGRMSKLKAVLLYALGSLAPTVLYVALFFSLVGIEELTGAALIPEEIGRSFLIVVGLGLAVWLLALVPCAVLIVRARAR